jgi:hypothetical protein
MNSMAQQAVPKGMGQRLYFRAQFKTSVTLVEIIEALFICPFYFSQFKAPDLHK